MSSVATILMAYYMPHRTAGVIKKKKVGPRLSCHIEVHTAKRRERSRKNKYSNVADLEKCKARNSLKC